jgi:hypothetical protein
MLFTGRLPHLKSWLPMEAMLVSQKILIQSTAHPKEMSIWIGQVKARQETMHARLKNYKILKNRFYHGASTEEKMELHKMAVQAICTITQYAYENGHPPLDVQMP